jgi:hypothetical protein
MGVLSFRPVFPRYCPTTARRIAPGLLLAAAVLGLDGCNDKDDSKISSGLFLAPVSVRGTGGIEVLAPNLTLLSAIRPDSTPEDLANLKADSFVLGRVSIHDQATGAVTALDSYLVYESKTRSVLSTTLCGTEPAQDCSAVRLHYNGRGLDEAQLGGQGSAISPRVPSIKLENGWILSFDSGSRSIIAFRMDRERLVQVDGIPQTVEFRSFGPTSSRNFGRGNGLLVSTVANAEELLQDLGTFGVLRFLEVEPGQVLVFFATGAVHLLELSEVETFLPFDLNAGNPDPFECDPEDSDLCLPVKLLDGQFKLFPDGLGMGPLITPADIGAITGSDNPNLGSFTPACLTSCSGSSAGCGLFLAFDQGVVQLEGGPSSFFLTLEVLTSGGKVTGVNLQPAGFITGSPPFTITGGFCRASERSPLLLFEERTNTMLAYDHERSSLTVYLTGEDIQARRDPGGTGSQDPEQGDIELIFAVADVRDNRLAFNKGSRELLSFSYTTPVVVLSMSPTDLFNATGTGGNLNYIEPQVGTDDDLRVFNQQANSLLSVGLEYATLPVRIKD